MNDLTRYQRLGELGEKAVAKLCDCPECEEGNLKILPRNFKCADIICDFCGFLAQVKTKRVKKTAEQINMLLGAAWKPFKHRLDANIFFPLFVVSVFNDKPVKIQFIDKKSQKKNIDMFIPRKPLSKTARRAGWQGFKYDLTKIQDKIVTVWKTTL
ncbi:MAG: hypothetical protein JSV76_00730 [Candidatus Bathyarchaeota archaeon]|nr:MAG: hypothetical protein JSV76_00730 [Candidatus Bathyarchaeota archaeon]